MRDLEQQTRAVTRERIAAARTPVYQVNEYLDAFADDVVGGLSTHVSHKAEPAVVVLETGVVQLEAGGQSHAESSLGQWPQRQRK